MRIMAAGSVSRTSDVYVAQNFSRLRKTCSWGQTTPVRQDETRGRYGSRGSDVCAVARRWWRDIPSLLVRAGSFDGAFVADYDHGQPNRRSSCLGGETRCRMRELIPCGRPSRPHTELPKTAPRVTR